MARILLVFEYPTVNGGEQSLLALLPLLEERGFEFAAIAPADGPLADRLGAMKVEVAPPAWVIAGKRLDQSAARDVLSQQLAGSACHLLHANSLAMSRFTGPVARQMGLPSVGHLRDIVGLSSAAVDDVNCHTRLVAVSRATRDFHVAQGVDAERISVVYNGVNTERFRPRARSGWLHRELGLPAGTPLVGCIGQLIARKGQDVLVAAAPQIVASVTSGAAAPHFVFVGARYSQKGEAVEYEARLRAAFDTGPLAGRGHFLGVRNDVELLLPELSVLAHPARQEPLGRVLLEAAAAGTPIVATEVGGTREIFPAQCEAALVVRPDDPVALSDAVSALLANPGCGRRLASAARRRIEQHFALEQAVCNLASIYRAVLGE
jgi:glycosyltransferase involved in cell wall biosynthesis